MGPLGIIVTASIALLLPAAAYSGERKRVHETVTIDYTTSNPCTNEKLKIVGEVVLNGYYLEVEEGYRFRGEADYTDLVAKSVTTNRLYRVRGSKDDRVRMTVDIPVERTITQDALFRAADSSFVAQFEFEFSVSFFGDKDIELTAVRIDCRQSSAQQRPQPSSGADKR